MNQPQVSEGLSRPAGIPSSMDSARLEPVRPNHVGAERWDAMSLPLRQALTRLERNRSTMQAVMNHRPPPARGLMASLMRGVGNSLFGLGEAGVGGTSAAPRAAQRQPAGAGQPHTVTASELKGAAAPATAAAASQASPTAEGLHRERRYAAAAAAGMSEGRNHASSQPRTTGWVDGLVDLFKGTPWASTVSGTAQRLWIGHPLRPAAEAVGLSLRDQAQAHWLPLVRRHPLAAMLLGVTAGAALVVARPWRAAWVAPLLAQHLPASPRHAGRDLRRWLWTELRKPSVQAFLASAFAAWWSARQDAAGKALAEGMSSADSQPGQPSPTYASAQADGLSDSQRASGFEDETASNLGATPRPQAATV